MTALSRGRFIKSFSVKSLASAATSASSSLELRTLQDSPGEVGQSNSSSVSASDDYVHGLNLDIHVINVAFAFLFTVFDDFSKNVGLTLARSSHLRCSTCTLDDIFVCVEHLLHRSDGHEPQDT